MAEVSFGEWLKRQRKAAGLTQEQLSQQVGCSTITLRKIEAEERRPSAQIVEQLAEIFNIPQDERIAFLHFARGDWRSAPSANKEASPWHISTKTPRSNLPAATTALVGRGQNIVDIREYLRKEDIRLVTLVGPPGIGKTRLSIESSRESLHDFPDGVFFIALAPLDDPSLTVHAVVQALGFIEAKNITASQQLMDGIGDKQMLIVLDNCEHLIEDVALLVSDLLSACSRLKILATSRESLRVHGEWLYPVPTLDVPKESSSNDIETISEFPALTLFAERARAVRSDFALNAGNMKDVAAICTQLDGLPLAIELIAARMRLMSPQALLGRLNDQFVLSADGMRAVSTRQKTLQNAISWSYSLLSSDEQKLFTYLSVFSGGFILEAAESIFSGMFTARAVSDLIISLLDKSLLQRACDRESSGESCFSMLATIQQFALDHLRRIGHEAEARNWHMAYFLTLAGNGNQEVRGPHQIEWLQRLEVMRDNFRAALQWVIETQQTEAALQMARKLHWSWFVRGDHHEGRHWLGRVLALSDASLYPEAYTEALTQLAHHTWLIIGPREARPLVEQALSVAHAHSDARNIARALAVLGLVLTHENNFVKAKSALEESKTLFKEAGDKWGTAHTLMGLGLLSYIQGDRAKSLAIHEQALILFREVGDRYFQSVAHRFIGNLLVKQGDWMRGTATLREALRLAQDLNSQWETYAVIWSFAEAAQHTGNFAHAVRFYGTAKNIAESIGAWRQEDDGEFENNLAACRAALGESEFVEAVEQGHAMTLEQAIAYALEISDG